jgi:uncharacterized membrane protein
MLYKTVLFLHLASAFLVMGGTILARFTKSVLARQRTVSAQLALFNVVSKVPQITVPGALVAVASGSWLAWHMGYGFFQPWILGSYAIFIVSMVCSGGVIGPRMEKVKVLLEEASRAGKLESEEIYAAVNDPAIVRATNVIAVSNVILLILMVFKPIV